MTPTVKDAPTELSDLHAYPWADIEGATLVVRQEIDDNDPMAPASEYDPENYHTEERTGELVGRCNGMGIRYDPNDGQDYASRMGPCIYLETPEDTVLEVRTDNPDNELLAFEPPEGRPIDEILAEKTGRPVEDFELTDDMEFPEMDELNEHDADDYYSEGDE